MTEHAPGRLQFRLWPRLYAVARLRAVPDPLPALDAESAPVALVVGGGEVSLIAPEELVESLAPLVEGVSDGWRAITLEAVFPLDTVGLLAAASLALAEVEVPVLVFASHDTDHFLVPAPLVGRALATLNQAMLERFTA